MKTIVATLYIVAAVNSYSQTDPDWVYFGNEIGFDFYYKLSSILRGNNPFAVVIGVPLQEKNDDMNKVIKYITVFVTFYESSGIRAIISSQKYYYSDNTTRSAGLPKRDVPISYYKVLSKLYNEIR